MHYAIINSGLLITAVMALGMALMIAVTDRKNTANRPLALCLFSIGLALLINLPGPIAEMPLLILNDSLTTLAILAGFEWGRRIGQSATGKRRKAAEVLVWIAQGLIVIFWLLQIGYSVIAPELALTDVPGFFEVRGVEWAIFAPILGTALLCGGIAVILMMTVRMDSAEKMRLRVLWTAAPFLIGGMLVNEKYVPLTITIGILLLLAGSVRYLIIQGKRGHFMSQFLSPEVTRLVREEGMDRVTRRAKQIISVVVCDLRGFTAFARVNDSDRVVQLLEQFYNAVGEAAAEHDGTVKDHAGDGVLILVGAPVHFEDHEDRAVALAIALRERTQKVLRDAGLEDKVGIGVGIATGTVTVGAIRGAGQLEYVAVGNPVNLAARLCDRAANGEILADTRTHQALVQFADISAQACEPEPLKGFPEPVPVCSLA